MYTDSGKISKNSSLPQGKGKAFLGSIAW